MRQMGEYEARFIGRSPAKKANGSPPCEGYLIQLGQEMGGIDDDRAVKDERNRAAIFRRKL